MTTVATQYRDVTNSVFYNDHLFYFLKFINYNSSCLCYLLYVSMSTENLEMTSLLIVIYHFWSPKIEGHDYEEVVQFAAALSITTEHF